jgi:predicted house-cleaning noncanonical NTP pyrophosphatase (MazG superfamily)
MKLIRDRTPDLLRGTTRKVRDTTEFELLLRMKLMEEAAEVAAATSDEEFIMELGDLMEVYHRLLKLKGISEHRVALQAIEKHMRKGGFDDGLVLEHDPLSNKTSATL